MLEKKPIFMLIVMVSCFIIINICFHIEHNARIKEENKILQLEHDIDNYKTNWEPINRGVALTPKEIKRLRQLFRCK